MLTEVYLPKSVQGSGKAPAAQAGTSGAIGCVESTTPCRALGPHHSNSSTKYPLILRRVLREWRTLNSDSRVRSGGVTAAEAACLVTMASQDGPWGSSCRPPPGCCAGGRGAAPGPRVHAAVASLCCLPGDSHTARVHKLAFNCSNPPASVSRALD